jgi:putative lipoprotein
VEEAVVRGKASYRESITLPPDAVLEATLEQISRTDSKPDILETVRLEKLGAAPIQFEIPYDPAKIDESRSYRVRARIVRGDRLLFTTDQVYPVLTLGSDNETELLLVGVRSAE